MREERLCKIAMAESKILYFLRLNKNFDKDSSKKNKKKKIKFAMILVN